MKHIFEIWTDGSCKGNGQENAIGGYAFLIHYNTHEIARGSKWSRILQTIEWK